MQKVVMVVSVLLMAFIGVVGYPILARQYSENDFALITVLFFLNGFFGAFDLVKPAMIRQLAHCEGRVGVRAYLKLSIKIAGVVSFVSFLVFNYALLKYIDYVDAIYISLTVFVFLGYSVFWAVFEIRNMVGWASLIRSIGFSFFVVAVVSIGFFELHISPSVPFFVSHIIVGLMFVYFGRHILDFGRHSGEKIVTRDLLLTAPQNFSKLIIDFSDRVLVSMQGGVVLAAAYNAIYDVSAKVNIISQLFVSYNYPRLCRGEGLSSFVNVGLAVSIILALVAIGVIPVGEWLIGLYLGQQYKDFAILVPVMFLLSSLYSLAFFSQGALRSVGLFDVLAYQFLLCALCGLVLMFSLLMLYGFYAAVGSLFILKAPGALGYIYLRRKYRFGLVFDSLFVAYMALLVVFVGWFYFEVVS